MTLDPTTRLGPYEILAPLGAGGMGEVYRAKDTRLGREVAIKVLPADVAGDLDRLRRFEQEARAASALSHPNILTLFDVGRHDETSYLVTELLEGESLRARLAEGPLPLRKAIEIGVAVAHGLAAAHARGIVHRDLKPENLFLTRDGVLKILDFGLAKLTLPESGGMAEATTVAGMTATGMVMGTAGYMAPEQVRGEPADARADLFALGCVLYELVCGRRAFAGNTTPETMSAILRDEPAAMAAPGMTGAKLEGIVGRCLEKRPDERFQSARDLAFALETLATPGSGATAAVPTPTQRRRAPGRFLLTAGLVAAALLAGVLIGFYALRRAPLSPVRQRALTYSGHDYAPASSPDGKTLAFVSDRDGRSRIWIKQVSSGGEAPVTDGPDLSPRFFPDGQSLLYAHADGRSRSLYRIALVGGQPRKLIEDADNGDVSPDGGRIAFVRNREESAQIVSTLNLARADGSDSRVLLRGGNGDQLFFPRFSPDGRTIAVSRSGQAGTRGEIRLVSLDGALLRPIEAPLANSAISSPAWSGDGRSLFYNQADTSLGGAVSSEGHLVRYDFDTGKSTLVLWTPVTSNTLVFAGNRLIFDGALPRENLRAISLAASATTGSSRWLTRGFTVDREPTAGPDGEHVIFSSSRNGNQDIWSLSLVTGAATPLTDDPADDWDPGLTPDGKHLLWSSNRSGTFEIWIADADGSHPRQLTHDGDAENPTATLDGQWIVYASGTAANAGIWKVRADGAQATCIVKGYTLNPEVSPDGTYIAYRIFFAGGTRALIRVARLADGAIVPFEITAPDGGQGQSGRLRWMRGGKALAYVAADDHGAQGIFVQDFAPGIDTSASRRRLGGFDPDAPPESFGITRDDSVLVVAGVEQSFNLMSVENVPGIEDQRRAPR